MHQHTIAIFIAAGSLALAGNNVFAGQDKTWATCHALLMPAECATLRQQLEQAVDEHEQRVLIARYRDLIAERERLCPCAPAGCDAPRARHTTQSSAPGQASPHPF